ncbi:MAG: FKBP-type peptidyl-prolyl cis-trans isomerase, partial [Holophagales bacterium]|nr:FKBP-type peptidyl-prolyl cis-trans isomerase [Holophagales bacterium]
IVQLHFTGWDRSGQLFRTSRTGENKPRTMSLTNVFPGWREGIGLMVAGEKRRLWIPSHLGPGNSRGGPSSAVFDVELLGIVRVPNPPDSLDEPPANAERLPNGLHSRLLQRGQGQVNPDPDGRVLAHYIAWDERGEVIDSTFGRARPMAFLLDRMMPALSDVLQNMTAGERRQLWVPQFAHQGQWPGSPEGMMVFDLQLLYILPTDAIQPKAGAGPPGGGGPRAAPGGGGGR